MSLSSAFHSALSGLGVVSRRSEAIASNVANAASEGYARRGLSIASQQTGGVRVIANTRQVDQLLLGEVRIARAESAGSDYLARQTSRLEAAVAPVSGGKGITGAIDALDAALAVASSDPSSETRLVEVADAVSDLAQTFAKASRAAQAVRAEADKQIAADVDNLNDGLSRIARLDRQIAMFDASGRETATLRDQRQALIDAVSSILPVREVTGSDGRTRLVTTGGHLLVDREATTFQFTASTMIAPNGPPLGQISMNGRPVTITDEGPLSGGTLSAAFELRDEIAPALQGSLDRLALDISVRLTAGDRTIPATAAGLLTDDGAPVEAVNQVGLSARLALNAAADKDRGGETWKIRSGLGAGVQGPHGESTLLAALHASLSALPGPPQDAAATLSESISYRLIRTEDRALAAESRAAALAGAMARTGVDTDTEMQDLLSVERSYAANAKVIQALADMLDLLLR